MSNTWKRGLYYDREGKPIPLPQWGFLVGTDYGRVGNDMVGDVRVSTVWLGLDHSIDGPPIIFETMVFGGPLDGERWRYATEAEALEGHAAAVRAVREAVGVS